MGDRGLSYQSLLGPLRQTCTLRGSAAIKELQTDCSGPSGTAGGSTAQRTERSDVVSEEVQIIAESGRLRAVWTVEQPTMPVSKSFLAQTTQVLLNGK
ncbi:hypothetical protein SKAU_G00229540 [Synaphobranchus kaupii]|uniref:Uncharacterized protein n=1 Tax=Synaphobranchus kaupii TaxID=118154 RepID=A0A9Q1F5I2_SYNKA|nr:hypothetical protein SKAU_G00229540 [Synaphobranchus kaupii]